MSLKLNMQSTDIMAMNIEKIAALFPNCVTETAEGKRIDFDLLKQELSAEIVEGNKERYRLEWPGKREAIVTANLPTTNTLRPVREDSVNFDTTENIYIEGDNLEVLKLLQESYLNKIKMIYIDPPYNTGKDFVYKDNFTMGSEEWLVDSGQKDEYGTRLQANPETGGRYHSDWLSMMYPRLKLARNLLTEDGVIFISIDDNEVHNLRKICDEIFGEGNFLTCLVWRRRKTQANLANHIAPVHDFILIYAKSIDKLNFYRIPFSDEFIKKSFSNPDNDKRGLYQTGPLARPANSSNKEYELVMPNNRKITAKWSCSQSTFDELVKDNRLVIPRDGEGMPRKKIFLSELEGLLPNTWLDNIATNDEGAKEISELFGSNAYFSYPKPVGLLIHLLNMGVKKSDIILDFYSGSATTAHAVMQLNKEDGGKRKYIMVQLPEATDEKSEAYKAGYKNICEIGKERIRRAGRLISEQWSVDSGQLGVDSSNKTKINYDSKNISRVDRLAEGNGADQPSLFDSEEATQGGIVRPVKSDAEGGSIDSIEHSGGASEELNQGVSAISSNSPRLESRAGNTVTPMRESGLSDGKGHSGSNELSRGSEQNDSSTLQKTDHPSLTTNHSQLTTNHSQLTTDHSQLTTDIGFRVYRLDSTNMQDVYYRPQDYKQGSLDLFADNVKPDRSAEDLVTQIMLDWGLELSLPIERKTIAGKEVFAVAGNSLYCCFDKEIDEAFAKAVAKDQPLRIVFRDKGFTNDTAKENVKQLLKQLSSSTEMRVI